MKRVLLRTIIAIFLFIASSALLVTVLVWCGIMAISVSPYYHYRLNDHEKVALDRALSSLHQDIAACHFDEIRSTLIKAPISEDENIERMKKAKEEYGDPEESEVFRSSVPETASKYYPGVNGTEYRLFYFTKGSNGEFFEDIDWIVDSKNNVRIRDYSASDISDWETKDRDRERYRIQSFAHQVRIPLGARFIEVSY